MDNRVILAIANEAYPDGMVWEYVKEPRRNHGDSLAKFIVNELKSVFDPKESDYDQLSRAMRAMDTAASELRNVCGALDGARGKLVDRTAIDSE